MQDRRRSREPWSRPPSCRGSTDEQIVQQEGLNAWQAYIATLETAAAAKLWFVNDHIGEVEKAILAGSCDSAKAVSDAAIEQMRRRSTELAGADGSRRRQRHRPN